MSQIHKTGIITTKEFVEPDGVTNQFIGDSTKTFTPSTANNSTTGFGKWMIPDGAVAGDRFQVKLYVSYNGFDDSSTEGTFNIYFQGSNYTSPTSAAWQGTNPVTTALNNYKSVKTLVLSSTSGFYKYETVFTLTQSFLDTYYGSNIAMRSNYSNGTGTIIVSNITIIPEQYSTTSTPPNIVARFADSHITATEFIEI